MLRILRKLQRAISYAIFGYNNGDHDSAFAYHLLEFKLKRIQWSMVNSVVDHGESTLQSLRIALRLLNRINTKEYTYFLDRHDEKWGRPILNLESIQGTNSSKLVIERLLVKPGEEPQERAEFIEAVRKDEAQQTRDMRLLHNIMAKYSRTWWD